MRKKTEKPGKKLVLHTETLRRLETPELKWVAGGLTAGSCAVSMCLTWLCGTDGCPVEH